MKREVEKNIKKKKKTALFFNFQSFVVRQRVGLLFISFLLFVK